MGIYKGKSARYGELMSKLMKDRANFSTEEEFKAYAIAEVRRFISDLRSIKIELSLRPIIKGTPLERYSVSEKLSQ
jgi:hypothetical protein